MEIGKEWLYILDKAGNRVPTTLGMTADLYNQSFWTKEAAVYTLSGNSVGRKGRCLPFIAARFNVRELKGKLSPCWPSPVAMSVSVAKQFTVGHRKPC